MMRKGLGKGRGSGYYNLKQTFAHDKKVHRDAGLGIKQPQRMRGGYDMRPVYDTRKSFYGKADIRVEGNRKILKSYETDVAYIDLDTGKAVVNGTYSATTLRHIKDFLKQNGFKADTAKQIMKDYAPPKQELGGKYAEQGHKLFKIKEGMNAEAHWEKTRNGFRHVVRVFKDGNLVSEASVPYLNRTWESFDYQTALQKALDKLGEKTITEAEKKEFIKNGQELAKKEADAMFGSVAAVAKLGEIFGKTEKEKNDWKARMLKAGLGSSGLQMPDDWDTLSEAEKKKRLDAVIAFAQKGGKNYLNKDIDGKNIKLLEDVGLDNTDTYKVIGGFGASADTMGRALFIKSKKTGKVYRVDGTTMMKIAKGGKNGNYAWSKDLGGKKYKKLSDNIDRDYQTYIADENLYLKAFFGHKRTPADKKKMVYIWKALLKEHNIKGGKKSLSTRTARYLKHGVKDVGHDIGKGLKWTGRKIRGGKERIRDGKDKNGNQLFHQGDRIRKGNWSTERWKKATRKDNKQSGKKYEDWERPHLNLKTKKMVKAISWK